MKPVADWRAVLRHAWSIRFMIAAGLFSGLEIAWPLLDGMLPVPHLVFAACAGLFTGLAFISRLVAQKEFDR